MGLYQILISRRNTIIGPNLGLLWKSAQSFHHIAELFNHICCISIVIVIVVNVKSLLILFVHRWSYGVVLYEIFTIGNVISKHYFDRFSRFGKSWKGNLPKKWINYSNTWRSLRKQPNKQTKNTVKTRVLGIFRVQMIFKISWKYRGNSVLFFKQVLQMAFSGGSHCELRASFIDTFRYSVCDGGGNYNSDKQSPTFLWFYR